MARNGSLRVRLISTAGLGQSGSMRAYADTLLHALARHAPDIEAELCELDPYPASGNWPRRLQTLFLPLKARWLRRRPPDVWHVLDGSRAHLADALGPKPVVVTVHDIIPWLQDAGRFDGVPRLSSAARWWWKGNARSTRRAARVVCVSEASRRDVCSAFGVAPDKCDVVPHALNLSMDRLLATDSSKMAIGSVLHVGNNGFYKNRQGVLRIFSLMPDRPDLRLTMAGPRPTPALLEHARMLGISHRVDWLVDPGSEQLGACYRGAAALLFPSLYEGFGWPVLEAMAYGLPVIASNAGSLPEVLGDEHLCFASDDEIGMARAFENILTDPVVREQAIERGLARAKQFSETAFATRMRDAYFKASESSRRRGS